jgi:hypothetical protein
MFVPICLISIASCCSGYFFREIFIGVGENNFNFTFSYSQSLVCFETEFLSIYIKILPRYARVFQFFLFVMIYYLPMLFVSINLNNSFIVKVVRSGVRLSFYKFYVDGLINYLASCFLSTGYLVSFKFFDKLIFEGTLFRFMI